MVFDRSGVLIVIELLFSIALTLTMLPLGFFWSGCACCSITCTIFSDNYGSNTISSYTQVAGTWTVDTGDSRIETSSNNALLIINTAATFERGVVGAQINGGANTICRVVGNYVDDENYLYAEFEFNGAGGASIMRLGMVVAGVETELAETATSGITSNPPRLTLCWDGTWAKAICINNASLTSPCFLREAYTPFSTGLQAGLATVTASASTYFDTLTFSRHLVDGGSCPQCDICTPCSDAHPTEVHVELSGVTITGNPLNCADCDDWNDVLWVLAKTSASCTYLLNAGGPCASSITFNIAKSGTARWVMSINGIAGYRELLTGDAEITCISRTFTFNSSNIFTGGGGAVGQGCTNAAVTGVITLVT